MDDCKTAIVHGLEMWSSVTGETTCSEGADFVLAALDAFGFKVIRAEAANVAVR